MGEEGVFEDLRQRFPQKMAADLPFVFINDFLMEFWE